MENINNNILLERVNNLITTNKDEHNDIINQLKRMNGTVAANQKWRFLVTGGFVVSNAIIVPLIIAIVLRVFN